MSFNFAPQCFCYQHGTPCSGELSTNLRSAALRRRRMVRQWFLYSDNVSHPARYISLFPHANEICRILGSRPWCSKTAIFLLPHHLLAFSPALTAIRKIKMGQSILDNPSFILGVIHSLFSRINYATSADVLCEFDVPWAPLILMTVEATMSYFPTVRLTADRLHPVVSLVASS